MTCFCVTQKRLRVRTMLFDYVKEMILLEEYATKLQVECLEVLIPQEQFYFLTSLRVL